MRKILLLSLLLALPCWAAEVKVSAEVRVKPGRLAKVAAVSDDKAVIRWLNVHDALDVIESETGRWAVVSSAVPGRYRLGLYSDAGGPPAYVVVVVEGETPPVPPVPPVPPTPDPPAPQPVPTGPLRVLVLYESADLATMPAGQLDAMYSGKVQAALDAACAPDGKVKAHRTWDKDTDAGKSGKAWQDAMAWATRKARPGVRDAAPLGVPKVVAFRDEKPAGEWALPGSEAAMLALVERIKGGAGR